MNNLETLRLIIKRKRTNICLSADLTDLNALVELIDKTGPYICAVKLHSDIVRGSLKPIVDLGNRHDFMIIDDRKFCDIGNTVALQSRDITKYADFITVHSLPGPGIIDGLRDNCIKNDCSILLIAQMSSDQNLIDAEYTSKTIKMAMDNLDIVSGFICQEKLANNVLHFAPGCQLSPSRDPPLERSVRDQLGQKYNTPEELIQKGVDVLIVGRGIYLAEDPVKAVQEYQRRGQITN